MANYINELEIKIKTFTHDYYILQLPNKISNQFYKYFTVYKDNLDFRKNQINISPVARIYGTNQFGQKCCCHIHGYFPSFYIKADQFQKMFQD